MYTLRNRCRNGKPRNKDDYTYNSHRSSSCGLERRAVFQARAMPHPLQLQQLPSTLLRDRRADRGWATVKDVRKIVFTEGHCFPLLSDSPQVLTASVGVNRDRKSTRLNSSHRCISYAV